ncbi:MAG: ssDNA-binding domain-containing protein [Alphaproteobacteria bacterium]|uniref:SsDNA-binding domain-containing protein n=1 Tax=Candidatus Nitrobium versatile TaxID=2884831 RepID=A0A953J7X9_9BACT|nr:ssDNA-binding domain-containing protein [Candidatus Nitrobium versatile]
MNVYDIITERILSKMEAGIIPWRKPWVNMELPKNYLTKREYRGINLFILNMAGHTSPYWLTFKQVKDCKGHVKMSEQATPIVYWTIIEKPDTDNTDIGKEPEKTPILRYYNVFNLDQTSGIQEPVSEREESKPCERIILNMPQSPKILHGGNKAFYSVKEDYVKLPACGQFEKLEFYYDVLFHELVHCTGHASRLNRPSLMDNNNFGSEIYGYEELTAEFGAAYLCGYAGIERQTLDNSTSYLQSWKEKIQADKKLLIRAASAAQKAVDFILNRKGEQE